MLLQEFIYLNPEKDGENSDLRYDPSSDNTVLSLKDTRKTRLTLGMINKLRIAGDIRKQETAMDLELVRKMYANPPPEGGGMPMI